LEDEQKVMEGQYRLLYAMTENTPQMYSTSKIHNFDLKTFTVSINCSYIYLAAAATDSVLVVRSGYARMR